MFQISSHVCGNEYISLDNININDASINNLTLLHMKSKGLLDFRGEDNPLFKLGVKVNGIKIEFDNLNWQLISYWIPKAILETENEIFEIIILTPLKQKGFIYHLSIINKTNEKRIYEVEFSGTLKSLYHCVNEEKYFNGTYEAYHSDWNNGPVFAISNGFPQIALSFVIDKKVSWTYTTELPLKYSAKAKICVESNKKETISNFIGIGYEEVSSITAAIELKRMGFDYLLDQMTSYLNNIIKITNNEEFNSLLNRNLLYTLFFSTGITIDTEERVIVTSRSPKYYVSAAYWDRDSLLWAFPAIANADKEVAREILDYITTIQSKNIGIHSRFIDGTILEPGFELDELCSFIIALDYYIQKTNEYEILDDYNTKALIKKILRILKSKKSESLLLYETFLQPTDDMRIYPYLTYNNVLVWKVFQILEQWNFDKKEFYYQKEKEELYKSIFTNCVKKINNKEQFIWSIDDDNNYDIYDEPPGSLILLPTFDFISKDNEIFKNTADKILDKSYKYSFSNYPFGAIGCPHAPHPWILSLANNLRVFHDIESLNKLINAKMDNGIACESIDENTGCCTTGEAFATCAGYLSFSLIEEIHRFL